MDGKKGISSHPQKRRPLNSATRAVVSAGGVLFGLAGMEHGLGEILQGNVATSGIIIKAWQPASAIFGEEPALTIVPNFLATGVLAMIVGLMVILWAVAFVPRKNGGAVLFLLSIAQLLVGGGIAALLPAIMVSVAATRINSPLTWWRSHLPAGPRRLLAKLWPWSSIAFVLLFSLLLHSRFFFGENLDLILNLGYFSLGLMLFSIFAGFARDIQRSAE